MAQAWWISMCHDCTYMGHDGTGLLSSARLQAVCRLLCMEICVSTAIALWFLPPPPVL